MCNTYDIAASVSHQIGMWFRKMKFLASRDPSKGVNESQVVGCTSGGWGGCKSAWYQNLVSSKNRSIKLQKKPSSRDEVGIDNNGDILAM